jgi:hypothetical protein
MTDTVTTTYRVTFSTGGWRRVPWPFGRFEVTPDTLHLGSWGVVVVGQ